MTREQLISLSPLIILAAGAIAVMMSAAIRRSHAVSLILTLATLAGGVVAVAMVWPMDRRAMAVTGLLTLDGLGLFFSALILCATFAVAMFSYGYWHRRLARREEYYALLILSALGACVLAWSEHFASLFLGLELLSVSLYGLVAYDRRRGQSLEAGVKYLVLAGVSSAMLLMGMALVYSQLGTMQLGQMASRIAAAPTGIITLAGVAMILAGVGFKLALAPFHMWTPDVYQGAPAPVTAYIATVSKAAVMAMLLRYYVRLGLGHNSSVAVAIAVLAVASMFVGNLLALRQTNVKRILGYSSISHMGYMLVALLAGGEMGPEALSYYLVAYVITNLAALGVVTALSGRQDEAQDIDAFRGLAWRRPALAAVMTAAMLSLAGIPLTAGFIGKFYVLAAGVGAHLWMLVAVLAVNSGIGLYYYLRIVVAIFQNGQPRRQYGPRTGLLAGASLVVLAVLLVWLGTYPSGMIRMIAAAMSGLAP